MPRTITSDNLTTVIAPGNVWTNLGTQPLDVAPANSQPTTVSGPQSDICQTPDGDVYACWIEDQYPSTPVFYGGSFGPFVKHWNGSSWTFLSGPFANGALGRGLRQITSDAEQADGPSFGQSHSGFSYSPSPRIVCDSSGVYVLTFCLTTYSSDGFGRNGNEYAFEVWKWNGTSWTSLGGPFTNFTTGTPSRGNTAPNSDAVIRQDIAADSNNPGHPIVFYQEETFDPSTSVVDGAFAYVAQWNGSTWVNLGGGPLFTGADFSGALAYTSMSLQVDSTNGINLCLCYGDQSLNGIITFDVYRWDGATWTLTTVDIEATMGFTPGTIEATNVVWMGPIAQDSHGRDRGFVACLVYRAGIAWSNVILEWEPATLTARPLFGDAPKADTADPTYHPFPLRAWWMRPLAPEPDDRNFWASTEDQTDTTAHYLYQFNNLCLVYGTYPIETTEQPPIAGRWIQAVIRNYPTRIILGQNNKIYFIVRVEGSLDAIPSSGDVQTRVRYATICRDCFTCTVGIDSIIWFHKDAEWHNVGNDPNYNLYLFKDGEWRSSLFDPEHAAYGKLDSAGGWHT